MLDGNVIKLYKFSIINGAQTTTKIGKSKLISAEKDFALTCKIVCSDNIVGENSFILKISEASNSQKPIKYRDLKANSIEQRRLQSGSAANKPYNLAIEIKRGVTPSNQKSVEKWQRVSNEDVGQLIYACLCQHPGIARNSKNTMFQSKSIYSNIFLRKHDYNTLFDLVKLGKYYDEYVSALAKMSNKNDEESLEIFSIAKNGKLAVLSAMLFLVMKETGLIENCHDARLFSGDNINGLLITDYKYDDLKERLESFFEYILNKFRIVYENKRFVEKITSHSNFFKSEKCYLATLQKLDSLSFLDKKQVDECLKVFTEKIER